MVQRKSRKRVGGRSGEDVFPPAPAWPRPSFPMLIETEAEVATLLWTFVADVRLWSAEHPDSREGLFVRPSVRMRRQVADAVQEYPVLRWPLRTLEALVSAPAAARQSDVSTACSRILAWAEAHHMVETSVQFAEAAALAAPRDAQLAAIAGTACARVADGARAEIWFRRATRLGRRNRDYEWYIRGYIRHANLTYEAGDYVRAHRYYEKALRVATWRGRPDFAGQSAHGMLTIAIHTATYAMAEELALAALELYPANNERLPHLAHDIAFLLVRHSWHAQALRILDIVLPMLGKPHERVVGMGSVARAAAGVGNRERFTQAASEVELLAEISDEGAAMALVHVAEGLATWADWDAAERLAGRAVEIASRRGERDTERQAHATLSRIMARRAPLPAPGTSAERVEATVAVVLARLQNQFEPAQRPGAPAIVNSELPVLTTPV